MKVLSFFDIFHTLLVLLQAENEETNYVILFYLLYPDSNILNFLYCKNASFISKFDVENNKTYGRKTGSKKENVLILDLEKNMC